MSSRLILRGQEAGVVVGGVVAWPSCQQCQMTNSEALTVDELRSVVAIDPEQRERHMFREISSRAAMTHLRALLRTDRFSVHPVPYR